MHHPSDKHSDEPVAFQFAVIFGDAPDTVDCRFMEASGLTSELALESLQEQGENRFAHLLPNANRPTALVLKRGRVPASASLVAWFREMLEQGLAVPVHPRQVRIALLGTSGQPLRAWTVEGAWPATWTIGNSSSNHADLEIEQMVLHCQRIQRDR